MRQRTRRSLRLVVHGVTTEAWTRRHGVEPFSHPCSRCGLVLTTSLPFVDVDMWGGSARHVYGLRGARVRMWERADTVRGCSGLTVRPHDREREER